MERQLKRKPLGPAPIASFEDPNAEPSRMDTSGSMDSGQRLTNIRERSSPTPSTTMAAVAHARMTSSAATAAAATAITSAAKLRLHATTPRIDISRASSSSHHEDSRDSSPENVFEQVGTGTLQEDGAAPPGLGFEEEGTVELRTSTEELFFMDPAEDKQGPVTEREKATTTPQIIRKSPIMFKFDEMQAACLQQNARKDSASSEVAALLCISGRTSRISSVGSQGSAVSRLSAVSAVSAISRSPSPHRMLMETSFCGPKPLENAMSTMLLAESGSAAGGAATKSAEILEQLLLARKQEAADSARSKTTVNSNGVASVQPEKPARKTPVNVHLSTVTAGSHKTSTSRLSPVSRSANASPSTVVGITAAGTDYIRINLKPDDQYSDQGVAAHERVIEEAGAPAVAAKKPGTLSLSKSAKPFAQLARDSDTDAISKHPHQPPTQRLNPTASPKLSRLRNDAAPTGSRSPSPSTLGAAITSRKNSLCSLFRSGGKDASPEATANGRERSRSKSRENEPGGGGSQASLTPSRQNSILALFKGGKSGSGPSGGGGGGCVSNGKSPVDPEALVHQTASQHQQPQPPRPKSRLRYYDSPSDGKSIHIPLHTPPEERDDASLCTVEVIKERRQQSDFRLQRPDRNGSGGAVPPVATTSACASVQVHQTPPVGVKTGRPTGRPVMPPHVPDKDGSVRIPLRSPTDCGAVDVSPWSQTALKTTIAAAVHQPHKGLDRPCVAASISTQAPSQAAGGESTFTPSARQAQSVPVAIPVTVDRTKVTDSQSVPQSQLSSFKPPKPQQQQQMHSQVQPVVHQVPYPLPQYVVPISQRPVPPTPTGGSTATSTFGQRSKTTPAVVTVTGGDTSTAITATTTTTNTATTTAGAGSGVGTDAGHSPSIVTSKERKRILFTTKIGSGSEEQLFATQLSLSKTESLCSQLSEQASVLDSPNGVFAPSSIAEASPPVRRANPDSKLYQDAPISVTMRVRDSIEPAQRRTLKSKVAQDLVSGSNIRHSRYIENIDVILDKQKLLDQQYQQQHSHDTPSEPGDPYSQPSTSSTAGEPQPVVQQPQLQQVLSQEHQLQHNSSVEEVSGFELTDSVCTVRQTSVSALRSSRTLSAMTAGCSSESERDSELDRSGSTGQHLAAPHHHRSAGGVAEEESTGLVVAQESSFEDDLPYVPTTLPEERSHLVSLVPVKERALMEVRTCPVDRPRSTTPLNPACLEAYCGASAPFDDSGAFSLATTSTTAAAAAVVAASTAKGGGTDAPFARGEKLRISLPRKGSRDRGSTGGMGSPAGSNGSGGGVGAAGQTAKSPRRTSNASGRSWFEFAEQGVGGGGGAAGTPTSATFAAADSRRPSEADASPPPPLPPRKQPQMVSQWINFENIPEKRKPPKRITTLPSKETASAKSAAAGSDFSGSLDRSMVACEAGAPQFSYVNPDECQCECHESERDGNVASQSLAELPVGGGSAGAKDKVRDGSAGGGQAPPSRRRNSSQSSAHRAQQAGEEQQRAAASTSSADADNSDTSSSATGKHTKTEHISRRKT